jgi:hypothetical protein
LEQFTKAQKGWWSKMQFCANSALERAIIVKAETQSFEELLVNYSASSTLQKTEIAKIGSIARRVSETKKGMHYYLY